MADERVPIPPNGIDVVYNPGGHVVHIVVKLKTADSWDAYHQAGKLAQQVGGVVYRMYQDTEAGTRYGLGGVEVGGLEIGRASGGG